MGPVARSLYLRLPYPLKVVAASAAGARLRWWRYGGSFEARVAEVLARDSWEQDRVEAWRRERVGEMLQAALAVGWYRQWWAGDREGEPSRLADWPVVDKPTLAGSPDEFVAAHGGRPRYTDRTSGTTGTPLRVVSSRAALRVWFALHEARVRRWHGVSARDRWAILGGQAVAGASRSRPPYWVWNPPLHQLYVSSGHVSPHAVRDIVEALARYQPTHLVVYPSSAARLARLALDAGLDGRGPRVVVTNAEPVTTQQRSVIESFFGCPLRETYGMAEMVAGASECEEGTRHLWSDAGVVEVLDDDGRPVPPGTEGRLVATGLVNPVMPLVRYDTGDRVRAPTDDVDCGCGRPWPVLPPVEGRTQDMITTPDGRHVFWLNPVFYDLPIVEAQVVQHDARRVTVVVVPAEAWDERAADAVLGRLRERLGDMELAVECRHTLERGPSGKLRPVVSQWVGDDDLSRASGA